MDTAVTIAIITAASSLIVSLATIINQARTSRREHDLREGESDSDRSDKLVNGYDKYAGGLLVRIRDQETRIATLEKALAEERKQRGELEVRVVRLEIDLERACAERDRLQCELDKLKGSDT